MKREKVVDGEGKEVQVVKDDPTGDPITPEITEEEAQIALAKDLDITVDELKALQDSVKDEGGGEGAGKEEKQAKLPAETEALIKKLVALLTKLLQKYPYGYPQKDAKKDEGGDGAGAAGEAGKVEGEAPEAQGVVKVGSPISRERLQTLKGVVQTLQKLLDELDKKSKGGEGEETPAKKADEKGKEETKKEETPVKKDEGGDGAGDGNGKGDPALLEMIAELKGRVETMEQLRGTQKGQEAEGTEGGEPKQGLFHGVL